MELGKRWVNGCGCQALSSAEHPDGGWLPACRVHWPGPKTARCRSEVRVNPRAPAVGSEEKQVLTCTDSEASLQEAPPASTV